MKLVFRPSMTSARLLIPSLPITTILWLITFIWIRPLMLKLKVNHNSDVLIELIEGNSPSACPLHGRYPPFSRVILPTSTQTWRKYWQAWIWIPNPDNPLVNHASAIYLYAFHGNRDCHSLWWSRSKSPVSKVIFLLILLTLILKYRLVCLVL